MRDSKLELHGGATLSWVVLALDAHGAGFELHVQIFADKDDRRLLGFAKPQGAGNNAVVRFVEIMEDAFELLNAAVFAGRAKSYGEADFPPPAVARHG